MSQAARRPPGVRLLPGTDGAAHPVQDAFAAVTLLLGAVAIVTAALTERQVADLHLISSWTGLVGILTGGWGQFVSVTTAERFLLVIGLGASGVGLLLGIAFGGPFGGLVG